MNPIREHAEYFLVKGFLWFLRFCPASLIYGACRTVAFLFYLLAGSRRRIAMKNLNIAFPERSKKEHAQIARAAYDNFGQLIAESAMVLCKRITREDLDDFVDSSNMSKLHALEDGTEKGILAITGHMGNFELLAHYTGSHMKRPGTVVFRKGTNKLIDDRLVTPLRKSFGNEVIYKDRALPRIVRALRSGNHVGMLIDIKTNSQQGVPTIFFGEKTLAIKSSAYLQTRLGIPVIAMSMARVAPKKYKLIVSEPILWKDDGTPMDEQISRLTQKHHSAIEELIRQYPEQWLWMHNRWKT